MGIKFFATNALKTANTLVRYKSYTTVFLVSCLLFMVSASAIGADEAQKTLDFIDFKATSDGGVEIRMALSGKAPNPTDFTSNNPARISLDLPGVNNNLPWNLPLPVEVGVAKSVKAVQSKGRTRVVVSVSELTTYQIRKDDKNVFLTISGAGKPAETSQAAAEPPPAPIPEPVAAPEPPAAVSKPAPQKSASASSQLKDVSFASLPGDSVQVKLAFTKAVANPGSFTINNPARIVLDFPNAGSALGWKNKNIGIGLAKSVTAVESGNRTRVIINLVQLIPFESEVSGNNVIVTLAGSRTAATETKGAMSSSVTGGAMASKGLHRITNIDFRRGTKGEGRIIVSLSDEETPVSTGETASQIFVEFGDTSLPPNLQQRLDVIDFATPVQFIDISQTDDRARLAITPLGDYEYLAYHTGNTYTVEVKEVPKEEQEKAKKDKFAYTGDKLSLNFQDIEVRAVLQLIADFTGLNMVTSDSVSGNLTLRLKNVPWDQALDIILKTKGLAMRKAGNVIMVAPAAEIAAQEKLELEASKQLQELAPLRTELIQINFAKASDVAVLLKAKGGLLSKRSDVTVDARTNTLIISDTADRITAAQNLINTLDVPVRQVMIESRIVIADDDFAHDLGVRFGVTAVNENKKTGDLLFNTGSVFGTDTMTNSALSNLSTSGTPYPVDLPDVNNRFNVNMPVAAANPGRFAIGILGANALLDLELSALQTEGRGEVLSNPRVVTSNQHQARIEQGTEIPYQEASSSGATSVAFKKAVLSLDVTPQITPDDRIILDLAVNKDSVGQIIGGIPAIDTKEVETQVLINNGETVVLGGVYEQETREDQTRVPFFGDIPFLGALFRSSKESNSKTELLIFVTPKILKQEMTGK